MPGNQFDRLKVIRSRDHIFRIKLIQNRNIAMNLNSLFIVCVFKITWIPSRTITINTAQLEALSSLKQMGVQKGILIHKKTRFRLKAWHLLPISTVN